MKYASIPVEERLLSNPEKAFKSFISSLKQEILEGAKEEANILKAQKGKSKETSSSLFDNGCSDVLPVRPASTLPEMESSTSITQSLVKMLNKEKYVRKNKMVDNVF